MVEQTTDADESGDANSDEPTFPDRVEDVIKRRTRSMDYQEVGAGALVKDKVGRSYWFAEDLLESEVQELDSNFREALERGRVVSKVCSEVDSVTKLRGESRAPEFFRALEEQLGARGRMDLEYRKSVERASPRDADVPVWIAAEGKYYVAAWLAAHGHANDRIANALDVSTSTIKVNLSKFKNGSQ